MTKFIKNGAEFVVLTVEEAEEMQKAGTYQKFLKDFYEDGKKGPIAVHFIPDSEGIKSRDSEVK